MHGQAVLYVIWFAMHGIVEEEHGSRPSKAAGSRFWLGVLTLTTAGFAVELMYSVEASYAVPSLLETGLQETYASIVWAVGPILGLVFQGYLGAASDRCTCSWGRRRPFILGLAIAAALCAALFAYGRPLLFSSGGILAFLTAVVAFVGMDFSLDQFGSAVRMYLLDSVSLESSDAANYTYMLMLGLGSLVGSLISAINWDSMEIGGHVHHSTDWYQGSLEYQLEVVFGISLFIFAVCVLLVLFSVDERRQVMRNRTGSNLKPDLLRLSSECSSSHEVTTGMSVEEPGMPSRKSESGAFDWGIITSLRRSGEFISCLSVSMKLLWIMAFLDWAVYLGKNIFFTDYVGTVVYGGSPNGDAAAMSRYEAGVRMACWCRVLEDILAVVYCLIMEWLSEAIGDKALLLGGHLLHFVALGMAILWPSLASMVLVSLTDSIFVSNLETIPYSLIVYHKETGTLLDRPWPHQSDIKGKAVSLICSSMLLAQVMDALFVGALIEVFSSPAVILVVICAACGLGAVASMFVRTSRQASFSL